jgi:hypothetical protein
MRSKLFILLPLVAAGALAGLFPQSAAADTELITPPGQTCDQVAGSAVVGGTTTECSSPGNVQLNATPEVPEYPYPWTDEFYGPALMIGGPEYGPPAPAPMPVPAPVPHGGGGGAR